MSDHSTPTRRYRSVEERLVAYVDRSGGPDACWLWTGSRHRNGYGQISVGGDRQGLAHRAAWEHAYGDIPEGLSVCHHCDVRHCVNPAHLFLGTHTDNMHDASLKGRTNQGSRQWMAKLSEGDVEAIRILLSVGVTQRVIADDFGVSPSLISQIKSGAIWGHLSTSDIDA